MKYLNAMFVSIIIINWNNTWADEINTNLESITVIGTKTERSLEEFPGSIISITEDEIDKELVRDISDLIKYEPGVSVSGSGSRFGLSGCNIRGIDGDRVQILIDGIRIPDSFNSGGPYLDSRRDFVDVESIQGVNFGLFNITDRKYIRWGDTISIPTGSATQRFTQPGFHGGVNIKYIM